MSIYYVWLKKDVLNCLKSLKIMIFQFLYTRNRLSSNDNRLHPKNICFCLKYNRLSSSSNRLSCVLFSNFLNVGLWATDCSSMTIGCPSYNFQFFKTLLWCNRLLLWCNRLLCLKFWKILFFQQLFVTPFHGNLCIFSNTFFQ